MDNPLIVIGGATATGKSGLALNLAKVLDAEIISADSMQVYKYMDIGTAKPEKDELAAVRHYLVDELYPDEDYSVAVFQKKAKMYIKEIQSKGKLPILVGGTGFYINALLYDTEFTETVTDLEYRKHLYAVAQNEGAARLNEMLKEADPKSAEAIHMNNIKRTVRALEYYYLTGEPISAHNEEQKSKKSPYSHLFFIMDMPRERVYERINTRVDKMMGAGLADEVRGLLDMGYNKNLTAMQGLGYKEIVEYLEGNTSLEDAVYTLKQSTRRFAKRQVTWFSNKTEAQWIDAENFSVGQILEQCKIFFSQI